MGKRSDPLGDLRAWDAVKLREVWQEFKWQMARHGISGLDDLSDYNLAVYVQLKGELDRRGEQLPLF
jgi:hypothetical protein